MSDKITVITNNVPRDVTYGHELTEKERKEFDYLDWGTDGGDDTEALAHFFVRYKGELHDLDEFEKVPEEMLRQMKWWDGYRSDSFFSGLLVRYNIEDEQVVMGRYYS